MPISPMTDRQPIRLLFVVNAPEFFLSHRLPIALAARSAGYEVHVACAMGPPVEVIESYGFVHHSVPFARSGQNPLVELRTFASLLRLFHHLKPDLVHLVTIKPVLYGGIAARIARVGAVVSAVPGLGTVFLATSVLARVRRWLITQLYATAFAHPDTAIIFQNPDDRDALLGRDVMTASQVRMIRGSGVALEEYPWVPEPEGRPVVVMAARLLKDKGVQEYVEAARILNERGIDVEMRLIGAPDPGNPTSISEAELNNWFNEGVVQLLGFRNDIPAQYAQANIVCLPSYREGLPRSLVEAAACGRAVVTTDVPGCRDAITPGKTGLLVPVRHPVALADAIQRLLENKPLRLALAAGGRTLAKEAFDIETIVAQHLDIYAELLGCGSK